MVLRGHTLPDLERNRMAFAIPEKIILITVRPLAGIVGDVRDQDTAERITIPYPVIVLAVPFVGFSVGYHVGSPILFAGSIKVDSDRRCLSRNSMLKAYSEK